MSTPPQRADEVPAGLLVVDSGTGERLAGASILGRAAWSAGAFCIFEQEVPPGLITPAHHHEVETQTAYVVSGTIGFWVDGDEQAVAAGGYVVRPPGTVHSLWNSSDEPARMLEITTPATNFQRFVRT